MQNITGEEGHSEMDYTCMGTASSGTGSDGYFAFEQLTVHVHCSKNLADFRGYRGESNLEGKFPLIRGNEALILGLLGNSS
jgi:hypothetical protein